MLCGLTKSGLDLLIIQGLSRLLSVHIVFSLDDVFKHHLVRESEASTGE